MSAKQFLDGLVPGFRVEVSRFLPYESTDPERPGTIHAVRLAKDWLGQETLLVSAQCLERLKRLPTAEQESFWSKSRDWFRANGPAPLTGRVG